MIGHYLSSNNEIYYSTKTNNFSPTKQGLSCLQNSKTLQDFSSHQIFQRMHEILNIAKQNN